LSGVPFDHVSSLLRLTGVDLMDDHAPFDEPDSWDAFYTLPRWKHKIFDDPNRPCAHFGNAKHWPSIHICHIDVGDNKTTSVDANGSVSMVSNMRGNVSNNKEKPKVDNSDDK
jgi:hypothetical protein